MKSTVIETVKDWADCEQLTPIEVSVLTRILQAKGTNLKSKGHNRTLA